MVEGLWEYLQVRGKNWSDYWKLYNLTYVLGNWARRESFVNTGNPATSGVIYWIYLDYVNQGTWFYTVKGPGAGLTSWFNWFVIGAYTGDNCELKKDVEVLLRKTDLTYPYPWSEVGSHLVEGVIGQILHPPTERLVEVLLQVRENGGGSFTLSWTVPEDASSYRMKLMDNGKNIVDWLNFDPGINTFGVNSKSNWAWFAVQDVDPLPPPARAGTIQRLIFEGQPGKVYKFALKAYVEACSATEGGNCAGSIQGSQ